MDLVGTVDGCDAIIGKSARYVMPHPLSHDILLPCLCVLPLFLFFLLPILLPHYFHFIFSYFILFRSPFIVFNYFLFAHFLCTTSSYSSSSLTLSFSSFSTLQWTTWWTLRAHSARPLKCSKNSVQEECLLLLPMACSQVLPTYLTASCLHTLLPAYLAACLPYLLSFLPPACLHSSLFSLD